MLTFCSCSQPTLPVLAAFHDERTLMNTRTLNYPVSSYPSFEYTWTIRVGRPTLNSKATVMLSANNLKNHRLYTYQLHIFLDITLRSHKLHYKTVLFLQGGPAKLKPTYIFDGKI